MKAPVGFNPFMALMAVIQLGAAVWWCTHGNVKLGVVAVMWAASSAWLSFP